MSETETLNGEVSEAIEASRADRLETLEKTVAALQERIDDIDVFINQAKRAVAVQEKLQNPAVQAKLKEMERLKNEIMKDIDA